MTPPNLPVTSPQLRLLCPPRSPHSLRRGPGPAPGRPPPPGPEGLVPEQGSSLTSTDGPSGGGVDTHGWEAGRGELALTLPVLGPIWGEREGIRVAQALS